MMYKYYSLLVFPLIKHNEEGKDIHSEILNDIPHLIKNYLHVNCIQHGLDVCNDKVLISKQEVIPPISNYMIPMDLCKNIYN